MEELAHRGILGLGVGEGAQLVKQSAAAGEIVLGLGFVQRVEQADDQPRTAQLCPAAFFGGARLREAHASLSRARPVGSGHPAGSYPFYYLRQCRCGYR